MQISESKNHVSKLKIQKVKFKIKILNPINNYKFKIENIWNGLINNDKTQ